MNAEKKASGFTLIELLVVISLMVLLISIAYKPIRQSVNDFRFRALMEDAQAKINNCHWKREWVGSLDCVLTKGKGLGDLYAGFYDDVLNDMGTLLNNDDVPVLKIQVAASDSDRIFLGTFFADSQEVGETSSTPKFLVYPRHSSSLPMMYTYQSRANRLDVMSKW